MIKNAKKTEEQKKLIKFRNQLHNLLIRNPEIRICGKLGGDIVAWIRRTEGEYPFREEIYLPTSGKQELI